jgi:hypothetical protein
MKTRTPLFVAALVAGIGLAVGPYGTAAAQNANSLRDLVGARASAGIDEVVSRGFTFIDGRQGYGESQQDFYWNRSSNACVRVNTADGLIESITNATPEECNQHGSSGSSKGDRRAAAAIVGAAAIAAALAHKNNHHTDANNHGAQWDIGYNDGLHGVPYHNGARSDAYAQGYDAGTQQRSRNTSYHTGRGGYAQAARYKDLVGEDSIRAFDRMTERGFRSVNTFSSGDEQYDIYYNGGTGQCVQLNSSKGRVFSTNDLGSDPKCR